MTASSCPHVYRAINRITCEFARDGIPKLHANLADQYLYRSIDDVLNRLGPLLAKHRLCALPRVLGRQAVEHNQGEALLQGVCVHMAYELVSCRDGSRHVIEAWGEALDPSDKGSAKAMSAAYKAAMLQAFCIPAASEDADASSPRLKARSLASEPVQGWSAWTTDILDMIGVCERLDSLDRVRIRQAALLASLKRERPDLYAQLGERFATRSQELATPKPQTKPTTKQKADADEQPLPA